MYNKDDCIATKVVCDWLKMQSEYKYNFVYQNKKSQPSEKDIEINKIEEKINSINSEIVDTTKFYFYNARLLQKRRKSRLARIFRIIDMPIEEN